MDIPNDTENKEQAMNEHKYRQACFEYANLKIWAARLLSMDETGEVAYNCFHELAKIAEKMYKDYIDQALKEAKES